MRKGRRALVTAGVSLLVVGCLTQPSSAATDPTRVTINITAVVETFDNFPGIAAGDVFTGSYTYNPKATDIIPGRDNSAYIYNQQPYGMQLNLGDFSVQTDPQNVDFQISLLNNFDGSDNYNVVSYNNTSGVDTIAWELADPTQTALSNADLKKTAPVLSSWPSSFFEVAGENDAFRIRAHVTQAVKAAQD
jgi:hypothetical protein